MTKRQRAACEDLDPELFFPVGYLGPALEQAEMAKAVCAGCPLKEPCGREALERRINFGIWGGMDERERVALLHRPDNRSTSVTDLPNSHPLARALADLA